MKKISLVMMLGMFVASASFTSCKKEECAECHYDDANGAEVEMGEKCGEELEKLESEGKTTVGGVDYVVHCGEGH
ncbi:MAG: hypothetical protein ACLGGV_04515 [Bacteroidia bacterium]